MVDLGQKGWKQFHLFYFAKFRFRRHLIGEKRVEMHFIEKKCSMSDLFDVQ